MSRTGKKRTKPAPTPGKRARPPVAPERRAGPRRQEDRALREGEAFFRGIFEAAQDCIFVKDKSHRYLSVNPTAEKFVGLPAAKVILRTDAELFGKQIARQLWQSDLRAFRGETVETDQVTAPLGGTPRTFHIIKIPKRDRSGKIVGLYGMARDITDRKQAEEASRESEERYRAVVEDQTELICRYKADGAYTFVNEVFCRFFEKTSQALLGRKWQPQVVAEDLPLVEERLRTLSAANPVVVIENRVYSGNGEVRWVQFVNRAFFDAAGRLVETQAVGRDITERKRAEEAVARSQAELRAIYEHAPMLMCLLDAERRVLYANRAFTKFTGVPESELIAGRACGVFGCINALDDPRGCGFGRKCPDCALRQALEDTLKTGHGHGNIEYRATLKRRGRRRDVTLMGATARVEVTDQPTLLLCLVDIAERRRMEEALMRSREDMRLLAVRLAEIDEAERKRLSRELHDRVGQTLTALGINLAHVLEEVTPAVPARVVRRLKEACAQAEALADGIRGVMAELRPAVLDDYGLAAALRGYGEAVARRSGLAVTVEDEEEIGRLPPETETAVFRIAQEAVTNVLRHARATGVCITCEKNASHCRVIIADNGVGFDASAAEARRTSWGLAIMRERARAVGADLSVHSRARRGTTVVVHIPVPPVKSPEG